MRLTPEQEWGNNPPEIPWDKDRYDLNDLIRVCRYYGVSFNAFYSEASDELELEIVSSAEAERFHMKRAPSVAFFIKAWHEHMKG